MKYNELIESVYEILDNPKINKEGLILTYELPEILHRKVNEELYFNINPKDSTLTYTDTFELQIDQILVRFVKKLQ